jgi:outer membrane lipoprotein-sorting protein
MRISQAVALALLASLLLFPAGADTLEDLLTNMDRTAALFRAFSADLRSVQHTAVINEDEVDTGTMLLKRSKRDIRMLVDLTAPDRKTVALHEHTLEIYYPKMQEVQVWDTGQNDALVQQFLLIGFGTSGKDLVAAYTLRIVGNESIEGQATTRLELIPKSTEVLKNLKKLELWISDADVYPVQQKFYLAAGDYKLVTYTNVKVNPALSDSDLKLKAKDARRVFPQK